MRRQFRHGMARRSAQWLPVHARHGSLRAVHGRVAQAAAGASRPEVECQMDHGGRRRRRRNEPLDPGEQGARRLHDRLSHERRNAASRTGLSCAPRGAGVGRQCLDQVAAPVESRRPALVHARGNREIHRPARKREGAPIHLRDGRKVRDHIAVAAGPGETEWGQYHHGPRGGGGRRKVTRVEVSRDGGRNWRTARIAGPNLDKAGARFYYEFDWKGEELLLQSRVMDETGYVQPSKDALRKIRGVNSIYHNNGIQTWALRADGEVENVEVG